MSIEHTYKICDEEFTETLTKARAIRKHCLDCCSGYQSEVARCMVLTCPLFPFRFGNEKGLERMEHLKDGYVDQEKEKEELEDEDEVEETQEEEAPKPTPVEAIPTPKKIVRKIKRKIKKT